MSDIVEELREAGQESAAKAIEILRGEVERLMGRVEGQAAEMAMWKQQCRAAGDKLREADNRVLAAKAQHDKLVEAYPILREIAHQAYHALEASEIRSSDVPMDRGYLVPYEEAQALEAALDAAGEFDTHEYLQKLDEALSPSSEDSA